MTHTASWAPSRCVQGHANGRFSVRHALKGGRATLSDTGDGQVCFHSWNVTADCPERLVNCTLGSPSVMPDVCLTRLTRAKSLADVLHFHFVTVLLALLTSTSIFAPACVLWRWCRVIPAATLSWGVGTFQQSERRRWAHSGLFSGWPQQRLLQWHAEKKPTDSWISLTVDCH